METQCDDVREEGWPVTELEVLGRDMVDIGVWESAEVEEAVCLILREEASDGEPGEAVYATDG